MFPNEFLKDIYQTLKNYQIRGEVFDFLIHFSKSKAMESTLINGQQYTKAPSSLIEKQICNIRIFPSETSQAALSLTGFPSVEALPALIKSALTNAYSVPIPWLRKKDGHKPQVKCDSDLCLLLSSPTQGMKILQNTLLQCDSIAKQVSHLHLLTRQVSVGFEHTQEWFLDSQLHSLFQEMAHSHLSVAYVLKDNEEYFSDLFWSTPTLSDIEQTVSLASKNISPCPFESAKAAPKKTWVILTPSAFATLVEEFLLENLKAKDFMNGSGAFDDSHIGHNLFLDLTLEDNPTIEKSPFTKVFDSEGTLCSPVKLIEDGILKQPLFTKSQYLEFCAENIHHAPNIVLSGHASGPSETQFTNVFLKFKSSQFNHDIKEKQLVGGISGEISKNSVVVNGFTGFSCDTLTGQFSLDAEGAQFYENGALAFQSNVSICGNFFECLKDANKVIGDYQRIYNITLPYLATQGLSVVARDRG